MKYLLKFVVVLLFIITAGVAVASAQVVDINTADAKTLITLAGIGPSKAAAIIEYREKNGAFTEVEELKNVSGIGEMTLEKNRTRLTAKPIKKKTMSDGMDGSQKDME